MRQRHLTEGLSSHRTLTHTTARPTNQDLCAEGDSQLVVRQILGQYKVKTERLKPLHAEALALTKAFDKFEIRCVHPSVDWTCGAFTYIKVG